MVKEVWDIEKTNCFRCLKPIKEQEESITIMVNQDHWNDMKAQTLYFHDKCYNELFLSNNEEAAKEINTCNDCLRSILDPMIIENKENTIYLCEPCNHARMINEIQDLPEDEPPF